MQRLLPALAAVLALAACASDTATAPSIGRDVAGDDALMDAAGPGAMPVRIYQQNVYPGFNIDNVIVGLLQTQGTGDPGFFFDSLYVGMATLDATDWRERAARMVAEIEAQNPDVVSLNEMVTVERQGLQYVGLPIADARVDFLAVFTEELAKRNLPYKLVKALPLTYAPVTIAEGIFVTYYDRDALFVRNNVVVANAVADTFAVTQALPGVPTQLRGWIAADLTLRGRTWRFVATHPEPSWPAGAGQPTQIAEVIAAAGTTALPAVVAGDLNLEPTSPFHAQLTGAGFIDLLQEEYGSSPAGFTCCQDDPALRNAAPTLVKRIDYVMVRPAQGYGLGPMDIQIFGDEAVDRTASGMWPSDHAGLLAKLVLQKLH
jgi:endonuclease/exonuclease/phosphatase family metal-dependent hydrolase